MPSRALRELRISPAAERDLAEIWAYIADDSPRVATAFIEQLEAKFTPLLEFPGIGAPRDNLAPGLRVCPYQSYCVYYVHDDDTVTIVRVVHSARDVRAMF